MITFYSHNSDPGLGSILTCEIMINEKLDPGKQRGYHYSYNYGRSIIDFMAFVRQLTLLPLCEVSSSPQLNGKQIIE